MIDLAIADDHFTFRFGISHYFNKQSLKNIKVVLEASNGIDLLNQLNSSAILPNVLLLDVQMPVLNGKEAAEIILQKYPSLNIIFLSVFMEESLIKDFIGRGVKGFLTKNIELSILEEAIIAVNNNNLFIDTHFSSFRETASQKISCYKR